MSLNYILFHYYAKMLYNKLKVMTISNLHNEKTVIWKKNYLKNVLNNLEFAV